MDGFKQARRPATCEPHDRALSHPIRAASRAFSLLELIIVLSIAVILAGIAIPRFGSAASRRRADSAAERIAADLAMVKSAAKSSSAARLITFKPGSVGYEAPSISDPLTNAPAPYRVFLAADPYAVSFLRAEFGADLVLDFTGYGEPVEGGWVLIGVGRNYRLVSLDPSGEVTIETQTATQVAVKLGISVASVDNLHTTQATGPE